MAGCLALSSCGGVKKAADTFNKHPEDAAKYCADKFPIREEVIYKEGPTIHDTVYQSITDYIPFDCPPSDTVTRYKVEVKFKERVITSVKLDTVIRVQESTSKVQSLQAQLDNANEEVLQLESKNRNARELIMWLSILCLILLVWVFRKFIIPLFGGVFTTIGSFLSTIYKTIRK